MTIIVKSNSGFVSLMEMWRAKQMQKVQAMASRNLVFMRFGADLSTCKGTEPLPQGIAAPGVQVPELRAMELLLENLPTAKPEENSKH
jgi:hypothetical protein